MSENKDINTSSSTIRNVLAIVGTIVLVAISWGNTSARISKMESDLIVATSDSRKIITLEGNLESLEGRFLKIEEWKDGWIARVLPLDAEQDASLHSIERRVDRIELDIEKLKDK